MSSNQKTAGQGLCQKRCLSHWIGYCRVSKADGSQVLDLQRDALLAAGVSERHLYSDTASGKKDDRPGLAACLQALREGDTLVVWKLDRLGRSLAAPRERRARPYQPGHRSEGPDRSGCRHRHDHACGQAGLWHLCFARRVRARSNFRAHPRRACLSTRSRSKRRPQTKDDAGQSYGSPWLPWASLRPMSVTYAESWVLLDPPSIDMSRPLANSVLMQRDPK